MKSSTKIRRNYFVACLLSFRLKCCRALCTHTLVKAALWPAGAEPTDKTLVFPVQRLLREGDSPVFCCVPPRGARIKAMTLKDKIHPLLYSGTAVKAISAENLTIPTTLIKSISLGCIEESGRSWVVWKFVSCRFEFFLPLLSYNTYRRRFIDLEILVLHACCSSSPETQKSQLCDHRLDSCHLQLGLGQKTGPAGPQQGDKHTPHPVSSQMDTNV